MPDPDLTDVERSVFGPFVVFSPDGERFELTRVLDAHTQEQVFDPMRLQLEVRGPLPAKPHVWLANADGDLVADDDNPAMVTEQARLAVRGWLDWEHWHETRLS